MVLDTINEQWPAICTNCASSAPSQVLPVPSIFTQSLASVVADLRSHTSDRILWADAMCINQTDNAEKSI